MTRAAVTTMALPLTEGIFERILKSKNSEITDK
jgi:hypothetical protein